MVERWGVFNICMIKMKPRPAGFNLLDGCDLTEPKVKALATAATGAWDAILKMDLHAFSRFFQASFEAQVSMFPQMIANGVPAYIDQWKDKALAWKMPGAGVGGYQVLEYYKIPEGTMPIKIRRKHWM